jgi:hypothetical protein
MAYETGSATNLGDLITKLDTFLVANGWTQDDLDDGATVASEGLAAWNKNSIYVSVKWNATTPLHLGIHQALGHTPGNDPGAHPNDSGNGYNGVNPYLSTNIETERCVNEIGDGPYASYHFFEQDSGPAYVHVVVEIQSEIFRHFGWGELDKFNDWTGGEYCYGHFQQHTTTTSINTAINNQNSLLIDGIFAATTAVAAKAATIHAEGLPHQGASEKWLAGLGGVSADGDVDFQDTSGQDKRIAFGGARGGPIMWPLGNFRSDISTGHIPLIPMAIFTRDFTNEFAYFLGQIADVRAVNMFNFASGQEVTIGSDTWVLFPQARRTEDNVFSRTYYAGLAYKKVTA